MIQNDATAIPQP